MQELSDSDADRFSRIETALGRIERAASRLKAEAMLLRVECALHETPLVPDAVPVRAFGMRETIGWY
jgi:hypothetical protein